MIKHLKALEVFMGQLIDLTNEKFGRLTVVEKTDKRGSGGAVFWRCVCSCGKTTDVSSSCLRGNQTKSCGCLFLDLASQKGKNKKIHGKSETRIYRIWSNMKSRCYSTTNKKYPLYGGRGIIVCDRWKNSFANFYEDMGEPPLDCSLDRIDVNGNYEKQNCRWATQKEQQNNRRDNVIITIGEKPMTMASYCETHGLNADKVQQRLKRGWTQEKAVAK